MNKPELIEHILLQHREDLEKRTIKSLKEIAEEQENNKMSY